MAKAFDKWHKEEAKNWAKDYENIQRRAWIAALKWASTEAQEYCHNADEWYSNIEKELEDE